MAKLVVRVADPEISQEIINRQMDARAGNLFVPRARPAQLNVLGIDPGLARCGWALVAFRSGGIKVVASGCATTKPRGKRRDAANVRRMEQAVPRAERILAIRRAVTQAALDHTREYRPDAMVIEEPFGGRAAGEIHHVMAVVGALECWAAEMHIPVHTYPPTAVRASVAQNGRANDAQVAQWVRTLARLSDLPATADEADAIAVALHHWAQS